MKGLVRSSKSVCVLQGSRKLDGVIGFQTVHSPSSGVYIYVRRKVKFGKINYGTRTEVYDNAVPVLQNSLLLHYSKCSSKDSWCFC